MINKIKAKIETYHSRLSIRKRLSISNILMILVPVVISSVILILLIKVGYSAIVELYLPKLGFTENSGHELGEHYQETLHTFQSVGLIIVTVLVLVIITTIFVTNRFLTKFVFQRIREPLDQISESVKHITEGNLETYLQYDHEDEFKPVCDSINIMQQRLKQSAELTASEIQSRKELFAGISHDLRSPLTSVRAYTEALLDGIIQEPEEQRRYLLKIHEKEMDIERMVEQLFLVSKMELNDFPVHMQNLPLEWAVQKVVNDNPLDGLSVAVNIDKSMMVMADKSLLQRIVVNILENSYKYRDKEKAVLQINARHKKDKIYLIFADNGPGVSDEQLPKLFETFYRTDPARKNPSGGNGLGLAVIKKAVERMGGSVMADNLPKGGLSISIELEEGKYE